MATKADQTGINVCADNTKAEFDKIAKAVNSILETGHKSHSDQTTIQAALRVLSETASVHNLNISGSNFTSTSKTVNMNEEE